MADGNDEDLKIQPDEPWEIAAERTIALYKKTKPSFTELTRAVRKIQAAYRGYYVRKKMLDHLKPKTKEGSKVDLAGPPIDVAESREIDLGPMIDIKVTEDNVAEMFDQQTVKNQGFDYDPMTTITHIKDDEAFLAESKNFQGKSRISALPSVKSLITTRSDMYESKQSHNLGTGHGDTSSQLTSQRQSRAPSTDGPLQSRVMTQINTTPTYNKISFAQSAPKIVAIDDEVEILEDVQETADATEAPAEVPEDIADNITDTASVTSTVPDSANTTDVEDEAGDTTGNED